MATSRQLQPMIMEAELPFFAVLDGAQFEDLPFMLMKGNFAHRSLYREDGHLPLDVRRTAPQLIWLDRTWHRLTTNEALPAWRASEDVVVRLFDLVGERPTAVFWACNDGGEVLYRHLRTLNTVLLPDLSVDEDKTLADAEVTGHEKVMFRHADANVMAQVMPSLKLQNVARVLGPANQIVFSPDSDWHGRSMTVRRNDELPNAPLGMLKLSRAEADAIEARQGIRSQRRIASYLRDVAPHHTAGMDDDELMHFVSVETRKVTAFGVRREDMIGRWSFMQLTSGSDLSRDEHVRSAMTNRSLRETPDERIQALFDLRLQLLRERA